MFSFPEAGKSVDSVAAPSPGARHELSLRGRPGHGNVRSASRRNSTASSIQSFGGTLDMSPGGWTTSSYEPGRNAISTLLQPPIVRTGLQPHTVAPASSAHKPPTARDIPPVALTNITHVAPEDFAPYLSSIGILYEQLREVKENGEEASSTRQGAGPDEQLDSGADGYLRPASRPSIPRKGSSASLVSLNSTDAPSPVRRSNFGLSRKANQGPPLLSTIPNVYFDEKFHLENPRTFDIVSERSEVIRHPKQGHTDKSENIESATTPRKALATNAILQEKLSWYMDTIEVHLINAISTASTTFFSALGSLKELHLEAAESVQRINGLRKELKALEEEIVTNCLQIVQKRSWQENLKKLDDAVCQLRQIVDDVASCESLVDAGKVDEALASIDSLEGLMAGERTLTDESGDSSPFQLYDLRSASALQGVKDDLSVLRFRAAKAYESRFSSILIDDLRHHVESASIPDVLLRWSKSASRSRGAHSRSLSVFPTYLSSTEKLKKELSPIMSGLHRAKHVATAVMLYREAVLREMRSLIRRRLPSSSDDNESMVSVSTSGGSRQRSSQEKSAVLARNLQGLGGEDAEELLAAIYVGVTETLRRLTTQVKVLLDITSSLTQTEVGDSARSPPALASPPGDWQGAPASGGGLALQEEVHRVLDEAGLLSQAIDMAHDRITKLLRVRSEQTIHLPLGLFLRYFTLNLCFANECEAISGRSGTQLKTVVNRQITEFVKQNRETEMQKLAQGMESDQWNAKDFTDENAELLRRVVDEEETWTGSNEIWAPYEQVKAGDAAAAEANGTGRDKTRWATVESDKFLLTQSAIMCLEGVDHFLHLIAGIPSMTDAASSLVAYLQLFNSRCTQLILGAGATRSAGLKNITTKHLALASQALSFIATLVPHIREFVRRQMSSSAGAKSMANEFDKVRRLLQEHQESIHQKLVDIMSGRAAVHAKSIKAMAWAAVKTSAGPHAYMETLCKETTTLHRVLTKHLPATSIQGIMQPVFSSYKDQLGAAFKESEPRMEAGRQSMLHDIEHFSARLGKVDGFGDAGDFLTDVVKGKKVERPSVPRAPEDSERAPGEAVKDGDGGTGLEAASNGGGGLGGRPGGNKGMSRVSGAKESSGRDRQATEAAKTYLS